MTKRFAVALNMATPAQDNNFISYLKKNDMAWWRYVGNFWLLIDYSDKQDVESIRNELMSIFPGIHNFVMDVTGVEQGNWAGYGPNVGKNNMFEWLNETWDDHTNK